MSLKSRREKDVVMVLGAGNDEYVGESGMTEDLVTCRAPRG
jgi:hypothetical protein